MMLEEVKAFLNVNTVAVVLATMPDEPDDRVCLYEYGGPAPEFSHNGQSWENLRLQVVSRSKDYLNARTKAQQVYDLLNGQANLDIGGAQYLWIAALQSPFALGQDENNRHRVVINFELARAA